MLKAAVERSFCRQNLEACRSAPHAMEIENQRRLDAWPKSMLFAVG
jgi:hypothetical protein